MSERPSFNPDEQPAEYDPNAFEFPAEARAAIKALAQWRDRIYADGFRDVTPTQLRNAIEDARAVLSEIEHIGRPAGKP